MGALCRVHLLYLSFGLLLRNTFSQDPCISSNNYAMYVQTDGIGGTDEGIHTAGANLNTGSVFSKVLVSTDENPTAISYDVVEDLLYWAGNDVTIGKYIKKSPITGGTTQEKSLITCTTTGLGVEDGMIPDDELDASSSMSANSGPTRARLNQAAGVDSSGNPAVGTFGAWIPTFQADINADPHWISVNFRGRPTIIGIRVQGRADAAMWTTMFWVEYSQDYAIWVRVRDSTGQDATFSGNTDQTSVVEQTFHEPVVALYLRILPRTWEDMSNPVGSKVPALRFDVLGCKVGQCASGADLGVADGSILDSQLSASSGIAANSRLNSDLGWRADTSVTGAPNGEYVQVLFGGRVTVTGFRIVSNPVPDFYYPRMLNVQYWDDTSAPAEWKNIGGDTPMNIDTGILNAQQPRNVLLLKMVSTTGLRLFPRDFFSIFTFKVSMRFEVKGCRDPIISHMTVDGTCESKKIYWVESGLEVGQNIYYADLESSSPTQQTLTPVSTGTIADVELHRDRLYFAHQSSSTSSFIRYSNLNGVLQHSREVESSNGNIQSIAIDANKVYYSINHSNNVVGKIGYTDLALASHATLYEGTDTTFKPFDVGVYSNYVYMLTNKDSLQRVQKSLTEPTIKTVVTNTPTTVVTSLSTAGSLSEDLQFIKCISYPEIKFESPTYSQFETDSVVNIKILRSGDDLRCCSSVEMTITENGAQETVDFSLDENTAVTGTPRVVKFDADAISVDLEFSLTSDNNVVATLGEGDEEFTVMFSSNDIVCASLGTPSSAAITIKDYNSCFYFDPGTVTYTEEDDDVIKSVVIKREGHLQIEGQIIVEQEDVTATRLSDYDITTNTVMFSGVTGSVSEQMQLVSVTIKGDTVVEIPTDESFKLNLLVPPNTDLISLCPNKLTEKMIIIIDNDFNVYLQKTNIEVQESTPTVSIPVCREGQTNAATAVPYSVHDDSAKQGQDYNDANSPRQVTIPSGEMCVNIIINIVDDTASEFFEAFYISINQGSGNKQTYVQIKDDDGIILFEYDKYEITEADDLYVKLLREGDLTDDQDVSLVAVQGDANAGSDFVGFDGITFKAGDLEETAYVDIVDDSDYEQTEYFTLRLINGAGQIISSATVTILDNDDPPAAAVAAELQRYSFDRRNITVDENIVTGFFSVAVFRSRVEQAGSVTVTASSGTAISGSDYFIPLTQTVVLFGRDISRQPVFIQILDDRVVEIDETFSLQLSNPSDGIVSGNTNIVVTITDDEQGDNGVGGVGGGVGSEGGNDSFFSMYVLIASFSGVIAFGVVVAGVGFFIFIRPTTLVQSVASPTVRYPQYGPRSNSDRIFRPI